MKSSWPSRTALQNCLLVACLLWPLSAIAQQRYLSEPEWPDYQAQAELSGVLSSVGSDSMGNLMLFWAEAFKKYYPKVDIQIQSTGSSTAPPALTQGLAAVGPMSRLMVEEEIRAFETQQGYKPTPFAIAIDALAVFVHPDNPLPGLDLQQLDAIFSSSHNCGSVANSPVIERWDQLELSGEWTGQRLELFGRNSISGTYQYFKLHALCGGEFLSDVQERPGSASVVQAVSQARYGIGYSALAHASSAVRVLPLARTGSLEFVEPTRDNALNGSYPLARLLYIYVNHDPAKPLDPLVSEFIRMTLSRQGQEQVSREGYAPLPLKVAHREMQKLADPAPTP